MLNLSGQAAAGPWPAGQGLWRGHGPGWLGGFLDGDGEAEGFELVDVVVNLALAADAVVVVAGSEVVEPGGGVGEQVEDDHEDGAGDGGQGLALPASSGEAAVALAEEGIGAGGGGGDLAEDAVEPGVALARAAGRALLSGLAGLRAAFGPGDQPAGRAEDRHVQADLGDDGLGRDDAAAGDLV